jgi:hypothetical protein
MKLFFPRTIATVLSAAAAAAVLTAAPAANALPIGTLWIDQDLVTVRDPSSYDSFAKVDARSFLRDSNVQLWVQAHLHRPSTQAGCRAVRVRFTYAGGSTSTSPTSARVCKEHAVTDLDVELRSSTSKDLVSYVVELMSATDDAASMTTISSSSQLVGDAPDSLGTAERLDHDTHRGVVGTTRIFDGSANYFLQKHSVPFPSVTWYTSRAKVIGTLTWNNALLGNSAYMQAHWTYADGSTGWANSPKIARGGPLSITVNLSSDSAKEIVAVRLGVLSDGDTAVRCGSTKFGDYGGIA